ncbi:MAG TPA: thioredoxin family protein [Smithellaceae bacterium]|nr:thioredoxin family protein [Smithellaceae bacterium]
MSDSPSCPRVDNVRDLEQALNEKNRLIAMVYASWCPFCRKAVPVFEGLARDEERNLLLVEDDQEQVADLYGIDVFPTLILFEKGLIVKRLDGKPGLGLHDKQMADFIQSCPLL